MTCIFTKEIDGYLFDLVSDNWGSDEPFIMVRTSVVDELSAAKLGEYMKSLIRDAWKAKALSWADMLNSHNSLTVAMLDAYKVEIELVEQFRGEEPEIDRALEMVDAARVRAAHKAASKPKRREVQANYNRWFVHVGRRDGFYCAHCKSSGNDLQIDHIIPISKGGTNERENLQLLCKDCNGAKRDKIEVANG